MVGNGSFFRVRTAIEGRAIFVVRCKVGAGCDGSWRLLERILAFCPIVGITVENNIL